MSAASNSTGRIFFRIGRSLSISCSCRLIVWVETIAFFDCSSAYRDRRNEIRDRFAHAGPGFDHEVLLLLERFGDGHRHRLLFGAIFEVPGLRQEPILREDGPDPLDEIAPERFSKRDHGICDLPFVNLLMAATTAVGWRQAFNRPSIFDIRQAS